MKTFLCIIALSLTASAGFNILTNCQGGWNYGDATHIRTTDDGSGSGLYTNLVAWYMFDRTNSPCAKWGTNEVDYSISNSPATVFVGTSSGATFVASSGPTSSYYSFDADDFMILDQNLNTTNSLCVSYWANIAVSQVANTVVARYEATGNRSFSFGFGNMFPRMVLVSNSAALVIPSPVNRPIGQWMHVVSSYNNQGNEKIWVNGNLEYSANVTDKLVSNTGYTRIGCTVTASIIDRPLYGFLDDLRVYNIVLSDAQVANIFNATKSAHPNPAW